MKIYIVATVGQSQYDIYGAFTDARAAYACARTIGAVQVFTMDVNQVYFEGCPPLEWEDKWPVEAAP